MQRPRSPDRDLSLVAAFVFLLLVVTALLVLSIRQTSSDPSLHQEIEYTP